MNTDERAKPAAAARAAPDNTSELSATLPDCSSGHQAGPGSPDALLVQRLQSGDAEAGYWFVRDYYPRVFHYLLYLTGQRDGAEDLTQETFLQAWRRLETFDERLALGPWLCQIARREFLQALRRQRRVPAERVMASLEEMAEVPARPASPETEEVELRAILGKLPRQQRDIVVLHDLEGYTSEEIARIVDLPAGTVRYRLSQARERLRAELGEGDLLYLNEPSMPMRQWHWLPLDQMYALATRLGDVRGSVSVVRQKTSRSTTGTGHRAPNPDTEATPEETMERREFLRQAAVSAAGLMLTEPEKEVVDPRLTQKVTCAFKGTALADLCEKLKSDTGIRVTSGPSVADEKVTLFCEKLPLREVMRQLSRPFGYTWLRSGTPGMYRYELVQDLRSQLLEEELRNRDRNAALLALEEELQRFRPYLDLSPDQLLERARTAPPAEKALLEKLGGSETTSGLGWGPIQMYFRLSSQEKLALLAGETLYFSEGPRPGERPLPREVARGIMQGWRGLRVLKMGDEYQWTKPDDPGGIPIGDVPQARASLSVSLDHSELGQYGLNGLTGFYGPDPLNRRTSSGPYATGRSPRITQPDNARVNSRFANDPALQKRVTVAVDARREAPDASSHKDGPAVDVTGTGARRLASGASKLTTADVLEALHRATGLPIIADYYTRLFEPDRVSARGQTIFAALNRLGDTMRMRWNKEAEWLQLRSTSYYDDRLKEVPNRLLERWKSARREHGELRPDDLIEIAGLPDAQLKGAEMAEGAKEIWGLDEWDLARDVLVLPSLRYLAGFTPEQRRKAERAEGLPFREMSLAQQQGFLAARWPVKLLGTGTPNPATPASLEDVAGAVLYVDYCQPGWYEWRPPGSYLLRWLVPMGSGPQRRLVPRPKVRERTREAALQALRRMDPEVRAAVLAAAAQNAPRLPAEPPSDEAQIVPTELNLTLIYAPARQSVVVVSRDFWSVMGA